MKEVLMLLIFAVTLNLAASFALPLLPSSRCAPTRCSLKLHAAYYGGTMNVAEPPPSSAAFGLYNLLLQNRLASTHNDNKRAIPLAGVHDALSAKIFAQQGAPALFMSGFGVSASLLGLPDAGMTNLVEMEMMARNICSRVQCPVICDGDTGFGGASNMLRTISSLSNSGAAAITIEDQIFPKRCTIAAGSKIQIVDREEALGRIKCAIGARDMYNERYQSPNLNYSASVGVGPWIVARTDCRMAYGFSEVVERCLRFEELGAEIIYAENLQSIKEYETLRARLDRNTVTMVAQVQETIDARDISDKSNSKPLLTTQEIGEMGFDLALFGVTPLQCVVGTLESAAIEFLGTNKDGESGTGIISSQTAMADFATVKKVVGFEELEAFENKFPCTSTTTATSDDSNIIDNDLVPMFEGNERKEYETTIDTDIINGSQEGYIVTKVYKALSDGFTEDDLCSIFSSNDRSRLELDPNNVTLSAALMLLDPEAYPTQSRARKAIRQRSICISRYQNSTDKFDQLGKVISRIYPGDKIGVQRRAGNDYYSAEGANYRPPPFELPVIYEDEYLAIVNKPAGIVLYRDKEVGSGVRGGHGRDTLLSALPYVLTPSNNISSENTNGDEPLRRPQPVHRLDRPTSGLVVVAKRKIALVNLSQQFEFRKIKKTYTAIVNGVPLSSKEDGKGWNIIDRDLDGKSAITKWRVIRTVRSLHGLLTLVELKPMTGRYHQLRRHLAWIAKSPIVGDTIYDDADESAIRLRKRGLFLCSNKVELEHPHYNTVSGRREWINVSQKKNDVKMSDRLLYEDEDTGLIMIKAQIPLPDKFDSFLQHEHARATKFRV